MNVSDLKIHHIGVAVASIDEAKKVYVENGYLCGETVFDPIQNVNICFAEKPDELPAELIEPAGENSPVDKILEKSGGEPEVYHICYAVEDIEKTIAGLREQGWVLVKAPVIACACGNGRVAFLYSQEAGLIELLEPKA